jgi:ATP-dependent Clp protease ATP-binding subunit ClpC
VVLLDEIEKAHPDVWNSLLQIMEEGRLTDSFGRQIDFKNAIIIMTTNIGAGEIIVQKPIGFDQYVKRDSEASYQDMKKKLKAEMDKVFRPEFLNRVDDIIVFRGLNERDLHQIVDIELKKVAKRLKDKGFTLDVTAEAKKVLIEKGTNTEYGARPLRRAIENLLEDPMAEDLLRGVFVGADTITVRAEGEGEDAKLIMTGTKAEQPAPAAEPVPVGAGAEAK